MAHGIYLWELQIAATPIDNVHSLEWENPNLRIYSLDIHTGALVMNRQGYWLQHGNSRGIYNAMRPSMAK